MRVCVSACLSVWESLRGVVGNELDDNIKMSQNVSHVITFIFVSIHLGKGRTPISLIQWIDSYPTDTLQGFLWH